SRFSGQPLVLAPVTFAPVIQAPDGEPQNAAGAGLDWTCVLRLPKGCYKSVKKWSVAEAEFLKLSSCCGNQFHYFSRAARASLTTSSSRSAAGSSLASACATTLDYEMTDRNFHAHVCGHRHRIELSAPEDCSSARRAIEGTARRPRGHAPGRRRVQRRIAFPGSNVRDNPRLASFSSRHPGVRDRYREGGRDGCPSRRPQLAGVSGMGSHEDGMDGRNHFRRGRSAPDSPGDRFPQPTGCSQRFAGGSWWWELRADSLSRREDWRHGESFSRGGSPDGRIPEA